MQQNRDLVHKDNMLIANSTKVRYNPMVIASGSGSRLTDDKGRSYLDFGGNWALANLGYDNKNVQTAIQRQLENTSYAGIVSSINEPALLLAEKLIQLMPGDFQKKAWFGLSGSDAAEAAQRMVLASSEKSRILSFIGAMHGTNDTGMGLSGLPGAGGVKYGSHVIKAPFPDPYRAPFPGDQLGLADRCTSFIEDYLFKTICPPSDIAAIFVETVQSDSGDVVPPDNFMPLLRELCDKHNILLVIDDIKIGLGRTGRMFSYEHYGVEADLILLGKSLGGGLPLSAVVGRADVLDSGFAGFTTSGNAACCIAGFETLNEIERLNLVEHSAIAGKYLGDKLASTLENYEIVGDIRGLGLIQGVDLVQDKISKLPNREAASSIVYRCWELGLLLYYVGNSGNVLEITPPLVLTMDEIDEGTSILNQAFNDYIDGKIDQEKVAEFSGWFV